MKNIIFCFFVTFITLFSSAQDKQIKLAYLNYSSSNYEIAMRHLNRFKFENYDLFLGIPSLKYYKKTEDLQNLSSYFFIRTNLFYNDTPLKSFDSAYYNVVSFKRELIAYEIYNKESYNNTCLTYKMCMDKCLVLESQIEDSLFKSYTKYQDVYTYESFLQKFPKSKNYGKVLTLREDLIVNNALETKDLDVIEESLKEVTNEEKISEVRKLIENRLIDEAIKLQNEAKLDFCLNKFPTTLRRSEIEDVLENIYIDDAKKNKNIEKLSSFATKFPTSFRKMEVLTLIENYIIDDAISSRSIAKLDDCISKYPNAPKHAQMLILLEALEIEDAVISKDKDKIIYCINKYPLNPSIIYLKDSLLIK